MLSANTGDTSPDIGVKRLDMEPPTGPPLDDHQYTVAGLHAYEGIYGKDFVSPGGRRTTAGYLNLLTWEPGLRVLDVGCGLGGALFMMATDYGASVVGIDLSKNMADAAAERAEAYGLTNKVIVVNGDIVTYQFPHAFDIIHSREVFLHIHDKQALFAKLYQSLKPGGQLLFTNYCSGPGQPTEEFAAYITEFGYDFRTLEEMATLLTEAGFINVEAIDQTDKFIEIHHRELDGLGESGLTQEDQDELRVGWLAKIDRAERGEQRWGLFRASR